MSLTCLAYLCHNFLWFCGMRPANQIMPVIELLSIFEYHCTAFIKHKKIYLVPAALRPPLPALGGVAAAESTSAGGGAAGAATAGAATACVGSASVGSVVGF